MYSTFNEGKAVMAERVIRTIKDKMYRSRTDSNKTIRSWKPLLDKAVKQYNEVSVHSSIKTTPSLAYKNPETIRDEVDDHNFKNETMRRRKLTSLKLVIELGSLNTRSSLIKVTLLNGLMKYSLSMKL